MTLKNKHLKYCTETGTELKDDSQSEVSSTEERVRQGEEVKERKKLDVVKSFPYTGCGKVYKGASLVHFRRHIKDCSFKNQKELGGWVVRTSRKFDFDMLFG